VTRYRFRPNSAVASFSSSGQRAVFFPFSLPQEVLVAYSFSSTPLCAMKNLFTTDRVRRGGFFGGKGLFFLVYFPLLKKSPFLFFPPFLPGDSLSFGIVVFSFQRFILL